MTDPSYRLIRSKRRTLSISVDCEGALIVRAPIHLPLRDIEAFVEHKSSWIKEKQQAVQHEAFELRDGARLPYRGGWLTVRLEGKTVRCTEDTLFLPADGDARGHALRWRMQCAKQLLLPRVEYWMKRTGITPSRISFGNASGRWGSMTSQGGLRLNAALIHCAEPLCDYVIVHELCHIPHMNHSAAFHAMVRSFLPGADDSRKQLRQMGYLLRLLK